MTVRLKAELDKNLLAYTAAARADRVGAKDRNRFHYGAAVAATGLGFAVLASPADAEIVYTPASVQINSAFHLDVNGDGINDFTFYFFKSVQLTSASGSFSFLSVVPSNFSHNGIVGKGVGTSYPASVLGSGVQVSSKNNFRGFAMAQRWRHPGNGTSTFRDLWANGGQGVIDGYVGLKFEINKVIHYGWARLSVGPGNAVATLTGYAYETTPNMPILTGQTKGKASPAAINARSGGPPATLGALAVGSAGAAGRRKEEAAVR
jgi:hypothetical protein